MNDLQLIFDKMSFKEKRKLPSYTKYEMDDDVFVDSDSDSDIEMDDAVFCSSDSVLNIIIRTNKLKNEIKINMSKKTIKMFKNIASTKPIYAWFLSNGGCKRGKILGYSKIKNIDDNHLYFDHVHEHNINYKDIKKIQNTLSTKKLIIKISYDLNNLFNDILRNLKF